MGHQNVRTLGVGQRVFRPPGAPSPISAATRLPRDGGSPITSVLRGLKFESMTAELDAPPQRLAGLCRYLMASSASSVSGCPAGCTLPAEAPPHACPPQCACRAVHDCTQAHPRQAGELDCLARIARLQVAPKRQSHAPGPAAERSWQRRSAPARLASVLACKAKICVAFESGFSWWFAPS